MTTQKITPWISRKIANEIYEHAITHAGSVTVYVVQAPAGQGKTFLARDIGTRLGSATGYEPARRDRIAWSGILDLYDPDTNHNAGLEQRLIQAFEDESFEFDTYRTEREQYDTWFKTGVAGPNLEDQRRKVEIAFAQGMEAVTRHTRPVLVFDTVERLEGGSDPTQSTLQNVMNFYDDTASVIGWLIFQITQLKSGVVLLLGRRAPKFYTALEEAIQEANDKRPGTIIFRNILLDDLDETERQQFFANRIARYPNLAKLLTPDLQALLTQQIGGNPLLLDLALQTLLETHNPLSVQQSLEAHGGIQELEGALVSTYLNLFANSDRQILLYYLALARNGLFAELLEALEPERAPRLIKELAQMETLPFIKVREINLSIPDTAQTRKRRTYFLHDAMYIICDRVFLRPEQVTRDSQRLVRWYNQQTVLSPSCSNLLVESLFYRMRADPIKGYHWYLRQADQAIRSAKTGLDMQLRDAISLFITSATPEDTYEPGQSLSSPIDRDNIKVLMPELFDDFCLDSATLWIKRYTMRGKRDLAEQIGAEMRPWVEPLHQSNPDRYLLPFAEFLLWYGQVIMYGYRIQGALETYQKVLNLLAVISPEDREINTQDFDPFDQWRYSLILGRTHNNLGYTYWLYLGQYLRAVQEFQKSIRLFRVANLEEELANSSDNLGRVYALLGNEFQALQLIRNGLTMRRNLGLTYRQALSENSLANALGRFGDSNSALKVMEGALVKFRMAGIERGIGLGLITLGTTHRNLAETWRESSLPIEEALNNTKLAEMNLRDAVRIFTTTVREPIREVEAYNEIACCYRARYLILKHMQASATELDLTFTQGKLNFHRAIEAAKSNKYEIKELDSMQDMAVLMMRAGQYGEAERYLSHIRDRIPTTHKIQSGKGLKKLEVEKRTDAYYKLMGQVELLEGALTFEKGQRDGELPDEEIMLNTAQHYLFAVSYFNQYSGDVYAKRLTYGRIYKRFQNCTSEIMRKITQEHLPKQVKIYNLPDKLVHGLFEDVFGILDYGKHNS